MRARQNEPVRLWSLHPRALDRQGLLAVWREGLLARKVLAGETRGYRHHPQLQRFREHPRPATAIAAYLHAVADEADRRGYRFDRRRVGQSQPATPLLPVTEGQLRFEAEQLASKLRRRAPHLPAARDPDAPPVAHPLFQVIAGPIAPWERSHPR